MNRSFIFVILLGMINLCNASGAPWNRNRWDSVGDNYQRAIIRMERERGTFSGWWRSWNLRSCWSRQRPVELFENPPLLYAVRQAAKEKKTCQVDIFSSDINNTQISSNRDDYTAKQDSKDLKRANKMRSCPICLEDFSPEEIEKIVHFECSPYHLLHMTCLENLKTHNRARCPFNCQNNNKEITSAVLKDIFEK